MVDGRPIGCYTVAIRSQHRGEALPGLTTQTTPGETGPVQSSGPVEGFSVAGRELRRGVPGDRSKEPSRRDLPPGYSVRPLIRWTFRSPAVPTYRSYCTSSISCKDG